MFNKSKWVRAHLADIEFFLITYIARVNIDLPIIIIMYTVNRITENKIFIFSFDSFRAGDGICGTDKKLQICEDISRITFY